MTDSGYDPAVLLGLLWNPPYAAQYDDAAAAHDWAVRYLNRPAAGIQLPADAELRVAAAAEQIAAADYLPGPAPICDWTTRTPPATVAHPLSPGHDTDRSPICLPTQTEVVAAIKHCWPDESLSFQRALAIWRWLPDALRAQQSIERVDGKICGPEGAARQSHVPVAHPAYPDSVWAVGSLRAARVAAGDKPAILFFSLASVQEYISQARRTQDLWMGSYLYAYLMWHAMRPIVAELGPWSILTPDLRGLPFLDLWLKDTQKVQPPSGLAPEADRFAQLLQVANLPNVFTALVPGDNLGQYAEKAVAGITEARDRLSDVVKQHLQPAVLVALAKTKGRIEQERNSEDQERRVQDVQAALDAPQSWQGLWDQQMANFAVPDAFWAVVPWQSPTEDQQILASVLRGGFANATEAWGTWIDRAGGSDKAPSGAGFPLVARAASMLHATRKNARDFGQAPEAGRGPLCTLCGARSAIRLHTGTLRDQRIAWEELGKVERSAGAKLQGRIRRGEQLCAVCLTKRLALDSYFDQDDPAPKKRHEAMPDGSEDRLELDRHLFASTATVATSPFRRLLVGQLRDAVRDLQPDGGSAANQERQEVSASLLEKVASWLTALNAAVKPEERVAATVPREARVPEEAIKRHQVLKYLDRLDGSWFYPSDYESEAIQRELDLEPGDVGDVRATGQALENLLARNGPLRSRIELVRRQARERTEAELKEQRLEPAERRERIRQAMDGAAPPYRPPARYYAVVNVDGDGIGKWISGKNNSTFGKLMSPCSLEDLKRPPGPLSQAALSTAGSNFAFHVAPRVVAEHHGDLIFAGGDDTLALVAREDALSLARCLRREFEQRYTPDGDLLMGPEATLSAAIVIAHVTEPLAEVIRAAHAVLDTFAKDSYGRDAFAIQLRKRSGPAVTAGITWEVKKPESSPAPEVDVNCAARLDEIRVAFAGDLARGLLGDLRRDGRALGARGGPQLDDADHALIRGELLRLAGRHLPDGSQKALNDAFGDLYDATRVRSATKDPDTGKYVYYAKDQKPEKRPTPWEIVTELARVAEFLAREDEE